MKPLGGEKLTGQIAKMRKRGIEEIEENDMQHNDGRRRKGHLALRCEEISDDTGRIGRHRGAGIGDGGEQRSREPQQLSNEIKMEPHTFRCNTPDRHVRMHAYAASVHRRSSRHYANRVTRKFESDTNNFSRISAVCARERLSREQSS